MPHMILTSLYYRDLCHCTIMAYRNMCRSTITKFSLRHCSEIWWRKTKQSDCWEL